MTDAATDAPGGGGPASGSPYGPGATSIAPLTADDHAEWIGLWQHYLDFYDMFLPEEISERTFAEMCDAEGAIQGVLARNRTGRAVGFAHWVAHRSTWSATPYCYLEDLYVDPVARGDGVGRALVEHVVAWAREHGCTRVHWVTHTDNAKARALYDAVAHRSGMVEYVIDV